MPFYVLREHREYAYGPVQSFQDFYEKMDEMCVGKWKMENGKCKITKGE